MTATHTKRRSGCVFISLNAQYQSVRRGDFEQQLKLALGETRSREIRFLFRLYGRFDYAIITESSTSNVLFSRIRNAVRGHREKREKVLAFENKITSSLDTSDIYRIFCQWHYDKLKYEWIDAHVRRLRRLKGTGLLFDFLSHDRFNITLSAASRTFKELDTITDLLDAVQLGKKETFVVSSSGSDRGGYNGATPPGIDRDQAQKREKELVKALGLDERRRDLSNKKK